MKIVREGDISRRASAALRFHAVFPCPDEKPAVPDRAMRMRSPKRWAVASRFSEAPQRSLFSVRQSRRAVAFSIESPVHSAAAQSRGNCHEALDLGGNLHGSALCPCKRYLHVQGQKRRNRIHQSPVSRCEDDDSRGFLRAGSRRSAAGAETGGGNRSRQSATATTRDRSAPHDALAAMGRTGLVAGSRKHGLSKRPVRALPDETGYQCAGGSAAHSRRRL